MCIINVEYNGDTYVLNERTTFSKFIEAHLLEQKYDIALAIENGKIRELNKYIKGGNISFIRTNEVIGNKTYIRTALMVMVKAMSDIMGGIEHVQAKVEFSIGDGEYISVKGDYEINAELVDCINNRMKEIADADIAIVKKTCPIDDAIQLFTTQGMTDKVDLFRYRGSSTINIYSIDDYHDYFYGFMLPSTGYIKTFKLMLYQGGIILLLPTIDEPNKLSYFEPRNKLFNALYNSTMWDEKMGIDTVGDLNNEICKGQLANMILIHEALQEKKIGEIATDISNRNGVKFVMIAGPSSSGKTTFSHRLSVQLRALGYKPHTIAVDDYFVNRESTPKDKNGQYNYECLEAIDTKQFNEDMSKLLSGEEVEIPSYNFITGKREYNGDIKQLDNNDILVIEGIHCLNDAMSHSLPHESKYKIYISALTCLNIDNHNRIPTTDGRLLRRIVRDARTRGASAKKTINMWPKVREGEECNIFPYQESADAMFNSVLIYELSVIKMYAEPLLYSITKGEPEYYEAKRLLKFLGYFLSLDSKDVPSNSILREFIGGNCFEA